MGQVHLSQGCSGVMPQRALQPDQRLREHLEDALAEAEGLGWTAVAALIAEALDALDEPSTDDPE
jgi:hypothetical protein